MRSTIRRFGVAIGALALGLTATACRVPSRYDVTTVLDGLENPWDAAFSSDNSMFFTERVGDVNVLRGGAVTTFNRPPDVVQSGEGGMMGLAVDPAFDSNRRIYTCYLTAADVRVVRWTVSADWKTLGERADLITNIPRTSGRHSGCRLEFHPADGLLWVTTGDAADPNNPQNPASLGGKVLRITTEGGIPAGNMGAPFLPQIYAYGFRNPQGLSFRPTDNQPFLIEHGPTCDDEITAIRAGGNGGWAPGPGYNEGVPMTDTARFSDALPPAWRSGCPTIAPSGGTFVTSDSWGIFEGYLIVAVLKGEQLRMHNMAGGADTGGNAFVRAYGRLRTAVEAPDGRLYVLTDANPGRILLVQPVI